MQAFAQACLHQGMSVCVCVSACVVWVCEAKYSLVLPYNLRSPVKCQCHTVGQNGQQNEHFKDFPVHQSDELDPQPAVLGQYPQGVVTQCRGIVL
eukprot:572209-Pelagomonas_calceolata.AAC.3